MTLHDDLATLRGICEDRGIGLAVLSRVEAELARLEAERDEERDGHARTIRDSGQIITRVRNRAEAAEAEVTRLQEGLRRIVACDYRGNMPREQSIARSLLADNQEASEPAEGTA